MAFLDPELNILLAKKAYDDENPSHQILDVLPEDPLYISVRFTGDIAALERAGFVVGSAAGNIAYGMTNLAGLVALASHPQVEAISKQRSRSLHLDESIPDIRADQVWGRVGAHFSGFTGKDVIVGIVDTGIDFRHQAFRKSNGKTRILKIWDQTLTAQAGETVPGAITHPSIAPPPAVVPLGYGVEYNTTQIDRTLEESSPAIPVRHVDIVGHGTHVAGISAGDGSQAGGCHDSFHYIGVATEADLIMVRLRRLSPGDPTVIPAGSNFMIDAIRYILDQARLASKPAVINLSLGIFTEQMDGSSQDCQDVDTLLTNNSTGRAIVFSAGNDGDAKFHASGTVPAGPTATLTLRFSTNTDQAGTGDRKRRTLVILYSGSNLQVKLTSPVSGAGGVINFVASGAAPAVSATANGGGAGSSVVITNQPNRIDISITPPTNTATAPPTVTGPNVAGTWTIELKDSGSTATNFNAFCIGGSSHDPLSPFFLDLATSSNTLGTDASGIECISVGSYRIGGRLSAFSSRGPTLNATPRTKPEICAPGEDITSAALPKDRTGCQACCCECCQDFYVDMSGTSMSAPHITGVIALMLHKNPNLTHTQIKNLLVANPTAKPSDSTPAEDVGWGAGKVNAKAIMDNVIQVNAPIPFAIVEPVPTTFEVLRDRLLETERGPELFELFPKHVQEVMALVNTNKKVATVWHRYKGPVWARLALRAAHTPGMPIPLEIDGVQLKDAILSFAAVVKKYASSTFLADILRYEPELARFEEGMSLDNLIDVVGCPADRAALFSEQVKVAT